MVNQYIHKLNPGKDDRDLGFKSNQIINRSHRLHVLLSLLYILMLLHVYTPTDLLKQRGMSYLNVLYMEKKEEDGEVL